MVGFKPLEQEPTIAVKFFSAGFAACCADLGTFPLDVAKVRLQIQGEGSPMASAVPRSIIATANEGTGLLALEQAAVSAATKTQQHYRGMFHTIYTIAREEGIIALYSGLVPGLQRQMCFASVRIGLYDIVKQQYTKIIGEKKNSKNIPLRIAAGITTGGLAVIVAQPTDVVKVRMQAPGGKARYTKGSFEAYRRIGREEGIKGLWKGAIPNITRNAVVNCTELVSYDLIKEFIISKQLMGDTFPCHFTSAFCAGFITTCFASPVDVVKTRFMNSGPGQYKGAIQCAISMFKEGGVIAFYKGFVPNYMRLGSWNILMFVLFEQYKRAMTHMISDAQ